MSREEIFFDAITNIREELVEEAQRYVFHRKRVAWRRYMGLAACLVLAAAVCFGAYLLPDMGMGGSSGGSDNGMVSTDSAVGQGSDTADREYGACPEDSPADSNDAGNGDGADTGGSLAPGADEPESSEGLSTEPLVGPVLEVHEDYLLVSWEDEPVEVPIGGLEDLPEFHVGDMVDVRCGELISQDGVLTASGVTDIWLVEP